MPPYPVPGRQARSTTSDIAERLKTLELEGVPYTDEMIEKAKADLEAQINPDVEGRERASSRAIPRRRCASSTATPIRLPASSTP